MGKNVVLYNRISTPQQSIESQLMKLEEYCKKKDYRIQKRFEEQISGNSDLEDRKAMNQLLEYCKENKSTISGVVVWDISRLSRNLIIGLTIVEKLANIKVAVLNMSRDSSTLDEDGNYTDSNELILSIDSIIASQERKKIRDNMMRGKENKIRNHGYAGYGKYLPYGYKNVDKRLLIDINERKIVELIFYLCSIGFGAQLIAAFLNGKPIDCKQNKIDENTVNGIIEFYLKLEISDNEIGYEKYCINLKHKVLTRCAKINDSVFFKKSNIRKEASEFVFSDKTILGILKNPLYIGKRKYTIYEISSPVIISEDVFFNVQELLKKRKEKFERKTSYNYLINNRIIKCSICGNNMFAIRRSDHSDNRFACYSSRLGVSCGMPGIGINRLINSIFFFLSDKKEIINHIKKTTDISKLKSSIEYLEDKIINCEKDVKNLSNSILALNERAIKYKMNDDEFEPLYNGYRKRKEVCINEMDSYKSEIVDLKIKINNKEKLPLLIKKFVSAQSDVKDLFNSFVERIVVYPSSDNPLSNNMQDKAIYLELFIKGSDESINFMISQRSTNILILKDEFDKVNKCLNTQYNIIKTEDLPQMNILNIIDLTNEKSHRLIKLAAITYIVDRCKTGIKTAILVNQIFKIADGYN